MRATDDRSAGDTRWTGIRWTAEEAQAMDRWLVEERGFTIPQLMAVAGQRVAEAARALIAERGLRRAVFLVGPGNNGGDALLAESHLRSELPTLVWRPLAGDPPPLEAGTLLVDGLFGVGLARPIEGHARQAVEHVNASPAAVLAVDIPSGLHATTGEMVTGGVVTGGVVTGEVATGEVAGVAIRAHRTLTFVGPKRGFFHGGGPSLVGLWRAVDIGFPVAEAEAWVTARRAAGGSAGPA